MGSLSALFDMSRNALTADQAALNATANNVANQNTAGYTREIVSFSAGDTVTLSGSGPGTGVGTSTGPTATVSSVRDRVLEQRVQQQMQLQSSTGATSDLLSQIQNVFSPSADSTTAGSTQIGTALNSFFSSLTALAGDPTDSATQQGVLSAGSALASTLNSASAQLSQISATMNGTISTSVTAVNALTTTIAGLNRQISQVSPNGDAGALEDQRQQAIEQLSQYVGLDQITTQSNGITLTTQGGAVLVCGAAASALQAVNSGGGTTVIEDSAGNDVSAGVEGGSLGGLLGVQNDEMPAVKTALDGLAYQIATAVNAQNEAGTTPSGAPGGLIFAVGPNQIGASSTIAVVADASQIASAVAGEGESGSRNANALANLAEATNSSGQTMSGSLGVMLSQIGSDASSSSDQNTAQQATLTQLTTQRDSLSAVSLDTEAANLSQYQKSYQAAAQLLTVLDSLMATAINLGTQTTVS
jgi:flagellar hook-associated protein 1 FlgK